MLLYKTSDLNITYPWFEFNMTPAGLKMIGI